MSSARPSITKPELFARLAEGHAAGVTVVTPNRRLAQVLKSEFDRTQAARGLAVWEDADILPLASFVERCYEDALYADRGGDLPLLLPEAQARELWEATIAASRWGGELLDVPQTAVRAAEAWRLAQAWRIAGAFEKFDGTEDARAFAEWARAYAGRCRAEGYADAAVLPDLMAGKVAKKPQLLVAYAFDILPPQAAAFLESAGAETCSCAPERQVSTPCRRSYASPGDELENAARWARSKVEAGLTHIGVVVPDLQLRRKSVVRVFSRIMRPDFNLPGSARGVMPFDVSLGEPLTQVPVVAFALSLLDFSLRDAEFEHISRLIRSPFLGGATVEMAARARLDARLRRTADATLSLPKLISMVAGCPLLRERLERVFALKPATHTPHDWAQHFTAVLDAAGFPGERAPDSAEFQARARFYALLGDYARLGNVVERFAARDALARLRRLCAETLFQPEAPDVPVQVLGLLESAGLEFDALWVAGLTDDAWPLAARPNPFLPVALQKKAGIPEAAAETSLALDRRLTEGWAGAAREVVFSWARKDGDRELVASPLIGAYPEQSAPVPDYPRLRDAIFAHRKLEEREDETAPAVPQKQVHGGTRVLADQAACPFRAFARWRLGAEALEAPEPGPDAKARGQLLHALMAALWRDLRSSEALAGDLAPAIDSAARRAVQEIGLDGRFAELEIARLRKIAAEWLLAEERREPFEVVHTEQKRQLDIGGLTLTGRIDRMDRFAGGANAGTHALIDYKTGSRVTPHDWMGARPDDPQLPLYAVTAQETVSAVVFAKVRTGDMKFSGFSVGEGAIPGVKASEHWGTLTAGWKTALEKVAGEFAGGSAPVDPKRGLKTCRHCALQTLCRVHERLSVLSEDEEGESE
jgi:probable DNA repair protein